MCKFIGKVAYLLFNFIGKVAFIFVNSKIYSIFARNILNMLYRKFSETIKSFLQEEPDKILLVNGARQIGKSYIIRYVCEKLFPNYIEINLKEDFDHSAAFSYVKSTQDFYVQLGVLAKGRLGSADDTIVFLDEIQTYPHIMTMLKYLNQEHRFRYIASGSQLGITLKQTTITPMGSISVREMFPLDFEEFLLAMGADNIVIDTMREAYSNCQPLNEGLHKYVMEMFHLYMLVGGMPEAVNQFVSTQDVYKVRQIQKDIIDLYKVDASQYDAANKLSIRRVYDLIPSNLENKKKRVVFKDIENKKGTTYSDYADEFEYLTASGVALAVNAISNPHFPLYESQKKNLLKLYLNDVGLMTQVLYKMNINAVLRDERSINLGTVYELVVAQEMHAHGIPLFYYDNKKAGEVDFIIDEFHTLSVMPVEVKSGKDYYVHSALNTLMENKDYGVRRGIVFNNSRDVKIDDRNVVYMPIYYSMFVSGNVAATDVTLKIPVLEG